MYLVGDLPSHYPTSSGPLEIELEGSSFSLSDAIGCLDPVEGIAVEFGCGGGIQLVNSVLEHPGLLEIHGYDLLARQRNVARFVSYLNARNREELDKIRIHQNQADLLREVGEGTVSLGIVPSFLVVPPPIPLTLRQSSLLAESGFLSVVSDRPCFDFSKYLGVTGWGGEDGLAVTLPLMKQMLPLLRSGGIAMACGDYAFRGDTPLIVEKLEDYKDADSLTWSFEKYEDEAFPYTPDVLVEMTLEEFRLCVPGASGARLRDRIERAIRESLSRNGIDYIHGGVLMIERH